MPDKKLPQLTNALEDYLETIFEFIHKQGFVRVKDIVKARGVKAGSVSPAMKRLDEMGLIEYERREYIKLTSEGESRAREIFSRHKILTRFFHEILKMDEEEATKNACAMEHSLTEVAKDHLVLFMEYMLNCPHGHMEHWERFHNRKHSEGGILDCEEHKHRECLFCTHSADLPGGHLHLSELKPGQRGKILIIEGGEEERRSLLNMGVIPGSEVEVLHYHPGKEFTELAFKDMKLRFPTALGKEVLVELVGEADTDSTT